MNIKVSYIVSVYKNVDALELIVKALGRQSFKDFELIVAEDNDGEAMRQLLQLYSEKVRFTIKHVAQPDQGFLKTTALNKAIAASASDYLIFTDGDCLPHRHFIKQHYYNRELRKALYGRRVMLSEKLTQRLYLDKDLSVIHMVNLLRYQCTRVEEGLYLPFMPSKIKNTTGIWGCNWSLHKEDLLAVNGFDEDYNLPGFGEDTDIEWRLLKNGLLLKKIKNKAVQYHLHHSLNYTDTTKMRTVMDLKLQQGKVFCENGVNKYLQP